VINAPDVVTLELIGYAAMPPAADQASHRFVERGYSGR